MTKLDGINRLLRLWYFDISKTYIVIYTPLFGIWITKNCKCIKRMGLKTAIELGLIPNLYREEGGYIYKYNFEKVFKFIPMIAIINKGGKNVV